ncbi:MAG: recombinase A [Acidobacteria bacterium OLB17]|nr:MAG: recombinase A [Acidobacteria bacterium OLB17]MCZ2391722.1 DNA recombination/repair protein RecA [Acidobacteriota bacterium]
MGHLSLVKPLSHLREEQEHPDEAILGSVGISFRRGAISELSGDASTGRTGLALTLFAQLTAAGEICALVDGTGGFDPRTAVQAGVELENLLWVRCGGDVEQAFISADHLVQAKGFGAIWLNLSGLSPGKLRLVPKTYWYRYRTRIKETPTIFVVTSAGSLTGSASHRSLLMSRERAVWSGAGSFRLLREFHLKISSRKHYYEPPVHSTAEFDHSEN